MMVAASKFFSKIFNGLGKCIFLLFEQGTPSVTYMGVTYLKKIL